MKAYYYLAQAQLALRHPNEALSSALTAYDLCLQSNSSSASNISSIILQAKKEKWEVRERERIRRRSELLRELEDDLERKAELEFEELRTRMDLGGLGETEASEEKSEIEFTNARKIQELKSVFAIADPKYMQKREVPDYLIDNISFAIMHDPVITRTGQSYDRATILEHLRRSQTDPLTREPLRREDLRPNLALRQVCADFLEENGWAVDW
ncbi:hypothetical protein MMC06_006866 [Schaereria dolodes]|nr:hypothetical protein [Schaereria dolodes]